MSNADQDVFAAINGINNDGSIRPWAWVHVRARTILGYATKRVPFTRGTSPATPSALDHIIGTAEQVSPHYIASDGNVWDLHDYLRVSIELLIEGTDPARLKKAREAAAVLRKWPPGWPGTPSFEMGQ